MLREWHRCRGERARPDGIGRLAGWRIVRIGVGVRRRGPATFIGVGRTYNVGIEIAPIDFELIQSSHDGVQTLAQFTANVVPGREFSERRSQRGHFAGEVVAVGEHSLVALTILLILDTIAVGLPVLGEKNQGAA